MTEGGGPTPVKGQKVTVHCTGKCGGPFSPWRFDEPKLAEQPLEIPGYGKDGDLSVPFWSTKDPGTFWHIL